MPLTRPTAIEHRLIQVESAVQRLEGQLREANVAVSQLVTEFSSLKERVEDMLARLDDHQGVLYGEKGKTGLIAQGEALEELKDALKGVGREPGLIADIRNLSIKMSEFEEGRKWLTRLIIGAILTDIVVRLIFIPH